MHVPSILLYSVCSITAMSINPILFTLYEWKSPLLLTAFHNTALMCLSLRHESLSSLLRSMKTPNIIVASHLHILNSAFGIHAAALMPLAMYTTLRRTNALFAVYTTSIITQSKLAKACAWMMVAAAILSGAHDNSFNAVLYAVVICNNLLTLAVRSDPLHQSDAKL